MATVLVNGQEVEIGASERLNCIQAAASGVVGGRKLSHVPG
jgi:hypothetical protein